MTTGHIVMAVHRPPPHLLAVQIASIRAQTLAAWTCRIGIDGTDADTRALLEHLVGHDPRFSVTEYEENVGIHRHFERLLAAAPASAAWVALSDQDDRWHPEKLARLTAVLAAPGITAATCQGRVVDPEGHVLGTAVRRPGDLVDALLRNQVTGGFSVFAPRVVEAALPFPGGGPDAIHDHWLGVVAAAVGRVHVDEEALVDYVQHGDNAIGEHTVAPRRYLSTLAADVRRSGGPGRFVRQLAGTGGAWRAAMAGALLERGLARADPVVSALAEGRVTPRLLGRTLRGVRERRFGPRAVLATLAHGWLGDRS